MKKTNERFTMIPNWYWECGLNIVEVNIISRIASWQRDGKEFYESAESISVLFGVSYSTIKRTFNKLVKDGVIIKKKDNRFDNFLFLLGLILGPIIYKVFAQQEINISISNSFILLAVAGLLVGIGTRIGGGCTSGHGISGIGRFSLRSIIATITFMIVGILTVWIKNLI